MVKILPTWRVLKRCKGVLPCGGSDAARRAMALVSGPRRTKTEGSTNIDRCNWLCLHLDYIINELKSYGVEIFVTDPHAGSEEAMHEYGVAVLPWADLPQADAIVAAVAHKEYAALSMGDVAAKLRPGGAFIDVKAAFDAQRIRAAGFRLWRL